MLKKILIGVGVVVVMALIAAFLMPSTTRVERSVVVDASRETVHATLNSYEDFNQWSPWADLDPNATYTFEGPTAGVGARMAWVGNDKVGSGVQEIVASTPDRIDVRLEIVGMGGGDSYFLIDEAEGGTKVTWGFYTEHGMNPINRAMGPMISKYVGQDYQKGLDLFKTFLESQS